MNSSYKFHKHFDQVNNNYNILVSSQNSITIDMKFTYNYHLNFFLNDSQIDSLKKSKKIPYF